MRPISHPAAPARMPDCHQGRASSLAERDAMAAAASGSNTPGARGDEGEDQRADEVGGEHDGPDAERGPERDHVAVMQRGDQSRQGRFGEQLLAAQDDDEEAEAVAKRRDQMAPVCVRQAGLHVGLGDEGEADRQASGKAAPGKAVEGAREFGLAFLANDFVDDQRPRCGTLGGLALFPFIEMGGVFAGFVVQGASWLEEERRGWRESF